MFDKIKREIKILKLFNHPHIIKLYEFIDTPSDIFVVLEYASGGELFDLISRKEKVSIFFTKQFISQFLSSIFLYNNNHAVNHYRINLIKKNLSNIIFNFPLFLTIVDRRRGEEAFPAADFWFGLCALAQSCAQGPEAGEPAL